MVYPILIIFIHSHHPLFNPPSVHSAEFVASFLLWLLFSTTPTTTTDDPTVDDDNHDDGGAGAGTGVP